MSVQGDAQDASITFENVTNWARANKEWDKVLQHLELRPQDFFAIFEGRIWPIAHQVVYHGHCDLFRKILERFDDQLDIHFKSNDYKTIFDVALQRREKRPDMYRYIERLYIQDQLLQEAKRKHWDVVNALLEMNLGLVNEKPPYSSCFLVHYIVENGDAQSLNDLIERHQCQLDVVNKNGETPWDMAARLKKLDMCKILLPKVMQQSPVTSDPSPTLPVTNPKTPEILPSSSVSSSHQLNEEASSKAAPYQQTASAPVAALDKADSDTSSSALINTSQSNDWSESPALLNGDFGSTAASASSSSCTRRQPTVAYHMPRGIMTKSIIGAHSSCSSYSSESPLLVSSPLPSAPVILQSTTMPATASVTTTTTNVSSSSSTKSPSPPPSAPVILQSTTMPATASPKLTDGELLKILKCPLSRQIFDDPVIAADGRTYERSNITAWVNERHTSPSTNLRMSTTLHDNNEMKSVLEAIKRLRRP